MNCNFTEDDICLVLGGVYGVERSLDCAPNVLMYRWWHYGNIHDDEERAKKEYYSGQYEADFLYITKSDYLYEVEVKISIADFRADLKKKHYHDFPLVRGFYYCFPEELYYKYKDEILPICKEKGAGIIIVNGSATTILKPVQRKDVKQLNVNDKLYCLKLFAKKWLRKR